MDVKSNLISIAPEMRAPRGQLDRIVHEVATLARRAAVAVSAPPASSANSAQSVTRAVEWAFSMRRAIIGIQSSEDWRDSFSRLGPPFDERIDVLVSEYQRSEMTIPDSSPLACYYPWLRERAGYESVVRYTANGMAAVGAFVLGLARWARQLEEPIALLTTPLFHETRQLLGSWHCDNLLCQPYPCEESLLAGLDQTAGPCALFLDSAEGVDTKSITRRLGSIRKPCKLIAVAWDNTCIPFYDGIDAAVLPAPLYLLRSHLKLDQLGLEIGPLGSVTVVITGDTSRAADDFLKDFLPRLPLHCQLLGVNASGDLLRRLRRLELPDLELIADSNAALTRANILGFRALGELASRISGLRLVEYPHHCFSALQFHDLAEPKPHMALSVARRLATGLHRWSAERDMPVFNSASFGFAFTAAMGFAAASSEGYEVPVLRVAFGGHDPDVVEDVASIIMEFLRDKLSISA